MSGMTEGDFLGFFLFSVRVDGSLGWGWREALGGKGLKQAWRGCYSILRMIT